MNSDLTNIADVVFSLYNNPIFKDYKPVLNKGHKREKGSGMNSCDKTVHNNEIDRLEKLYVPRQYRDIINHAPLDQMLKLVIASNIYPNKKITENGIEHDELKKAIEILKIEIDELIANNIYAQNDEELEKSQKYLSKFEDLYSECLNKGNFEIVTDFKAIAGLALEILSNADKNSEILYILINKKFGIHIDHIMTPKELWIKRWQDFELELEHISMDVDEYIKMVLIKNNEIDEPKQFEDYKREKERLKRYTNNPRPYNNHNRENNNNYNRENNNNYNRENNNNYNRENNNNYNRENHNNYNSENNNNYNRENNNNYNRENNNNYNRENNNNYNRENNNNYNRENNNGYNRKNFRRNFEPPKEGFKKFVKRSE
jgi:hypothetical protein